MVDAKTLQVISGARESISQANQSAIAAQRANQPTEQQLRFGSQSGIAGMIQRQSVAQQIAKYKQGVSSQEQQIESDIAKYEPTQAKEQYLNQEYQNVKSQVQDKIQQLQNTISMNESQIRETTNEDVKQTRQDDNRRLQAELSSYQSALNKPKEQLVQDYYNNTLSYNAAVNVSNVQNDIATRLQTRAIAKEYGILPQEVSNKILDIQKSNRDIQYSNQILDWGTKAGYTNLPDYAKDLISPSLNQFIKSNPNEKVNFSGITPTSIQSQFFNKTLSIEDYNKEVTKYNQPVNQSTTATTNQFISVVEPASKLKERYYSNWLETIKERPISGTYGYIMEQLGGKISETAFQSKASPFYRNAAESESIGKMAQVGAMAAFQYAGIKVPFLGSGLALAGGTESAIKGKTTQEKILGAGVAALGLWGLKADIKNYQIAKEIKQFNEAPLKVVGYRVEGDKQGVDLLLGYKKTPSGEYLAKLEQPFYLTDKGYTLEGGALSSFRYKNPQLNAAQFDVSGRGTIVQAPKSVKFNQGYTLTNQLGENVQGGLGSVNLVKNVVANLKVKYGYVFPSPSKLQLDAIGNIQKIKPTTENIKFLSVGSEGEGGIITAISGKPTLAKMSEGQVVSFLAKPESIAKIKKISISDLGSAGSSSSFSTGSSKPSGGTIQSTAQQTKQATALYDTNKVLETSMKSLIPQLDTKPPAFLIPATQTIQQTKQATIQLPKTNQALDLFPKVEVKNKQLEAVVPKLNQDILTIQRTNQMLDLNTAQIPKLDLQQLTQTRQTTRQQTQQVTELTTSTRLVPRAMLFDLGKTKESKEKSLIDSFGARRLYNVLVKRQGNWFKIGSNLPERRAKLKGSRYAMETLGRSFKLESVGTGNVEDINYNIPSNIFRLSKRDSSVYVQRSRFALSSPTERSEIQMFRRSKKKNKRLKLW